MSIATCADLVWSIDDLILLKTGNFPKSQTQSRDAFRDFSAAAKIRHLFCERLNFFEPSLRLSLTLPGREPWGKPQNPRKSLFRVESSRKLSKHERSSSRSAKNTKADEARRMAENLRLLQRPRMSLKMNRTFQKALKQGLFSRVFCRCWFSPKFRSKKGMSVDDVLGAAFIDDSEDENDQEEEDVGLD